MQGSVVAAESCGPIYGPMIAEFYDCRRFCGCRYMWLHYSAVADFCCYIVYLLVRFIYIYIFFT
jgi:hypothetical protein